MNERLTFEASPFETDRGSRAPTRGRWFRRDGHIIVLLEDPAFPDEQASAESWAEVGSSGALGQLTDALGRGLWSLAIRLAIQRGERDENRLTDTIFYARHPERRNQRLQPNERPLIQEWLDIRARLVRPALRGMPTRVAPATPAPTQPAAHAPSTTSGVEAAGNTIRIIPCIRGLQDQGRAISFVVRYLRDLGRVEAAALSNAGLRIVSCYEESAGNLSPTNMAYFTRAQGQHDGRRGFTQAHAVGQPADTPVYFAVDTDPDIGQRQAILNYFQGIADGYNQYLADMQAQQKPAVTYAVGVYGSGCVLGWGQTQGIASVVLAGIRARLVQQPERLARRQHPHLGSRSARALPVETRPARGLGQRGRLDPARAAATGAAHSESTLPPAVAIVKRQRLSLRARSTK